VRQQELPVAWTFLYAFSCQLACPISLWNANQRNACAGLLALAASEASQLPLHPPDPPKSPQNRYSHKPGVDYTWFVQGLTAQ